MPAFTFTSPEGKSYTVNGPDGATQEQAFGMLQQQLKTQPAEPAQPGLGDVIKGVGDAALSGASKVATGIVGAPVALANRLVAAASGGDPQMAADTAHDFVNSHFGYDTQTPVGKDIGANVSSLLAPIGRSAQADEQLLQRGGEHIGIPAGETHGALSELGDIANTAGAVAPAVAGVRASGEAATLAAQNAAKPITDIESQLKAVGYPSLPSKTPGASGVAKLGASAVGEGSLTGPQTLTSQAVTDRLAQHESGVPANTPLSYESIAAARAAGPGKVYDAAHEAMPPQLTQDQQLQHEIAAAPGTTSQLPKSPDVEGLKEVMLNQPNMTRDELFQNIAQARDRASRYYASDQPDAHEIGDAYQAVANAYEGFVGRQLAANPLSPVSLQDWQAARTQFAKNYAVQSSLKGTSVDASKLASLQRKDPELLTGGLQLIAEQHNRYPLSTGFGPTTLADTGIGSSGSIAGNTARHVTGPILGGGAGAVAGHFMGLGPVAGAAVGGGVGQLASAGFQNLIRRALGGTAEGGTAAAGRALGDPRLEDFFNPPAPEARPPGPLQLAPPPGRAFEPHQPELATASPQRDFFGTGANAFPPPAPMGSPPPVAGRPGEIPLMDVLSHGVEQGPSSGLSLGPMGAPTQDGIPFQRNAAHEAGDLTTHEPSIQDLLEQLSDHPAVMHQNRSLGVSGSPATKLDTTGGVPEDLMTRLENNASGESSASMEAINRTKREQAQGQDRFLVDPDGKMWPVRGVEAADATAPKGSIIVQKGVGATPYSILDRGGLPHAHAQGLLNRALAGGTGLNLNDLLGDLGG